MPPPKFPPLPGYSVEGIHGESSGPRLLIASGITLACAFVTFTLRMVVKGFIVRSTSWEDYFAGFALLMAIGRMAIFSVLVKYHQFGQHIWDFQKKANFDFAYKWPKGAAEIYLVGIACAKVSILLLYLRLFGINKQFRYTCFALMALVVGYCLTLILAQTFQCRPVDAGWDFFKPGHCVSLIKINIAIGAFNVASDFLILVAPIPLVLGLQLRRAKMIGVLIVLATGVFVVAVAIVRETQVVRSPNLYDATWYEAARELWLSVELNVGIICACLPLLSPLGRNIPGKAYFIAKYDSMISLIRESRSRSRASRTSRTSRSESKGGQPVSEQSDYVELIEPKKSRVDVTANTVWDAQVNGEQKPTIKYSEGVLARAPLEGYEI